MITSPYSLEEDVWIGEARNTVYRRVVVGFLLIFLSACTLPKTNPLTLQGAVEQWVSKVQGIQIMTEPQIQRTVNLPQSTVVLVTYDGMREAQPVQFTAILFFRREDAGWVNSGGRLVEQAGRQPLPRNARVETPNSQGNQAAVGGLMNDPQVVEMSVTFADGTQVVVPVENGYYLAAHSGVQTIRTVEARGPNQQLLFTIEP